MSTGLSRTDSALKRAEDEFPRKATGVPVEGGAIVTAMELTQPGSSKKKKLPKDKKAKGKKSKKSQKDGSSSSGEKTDDAEEKPPKMLPTVMHLERHFDARHHQTTIEAGSAPPAPAKEDQWAHYALCDILYFDMKGEPHYWELEIKSPHLKRVLARVIGEYPGVSFKTTNIKLVYPLRSLWHYLGELKEERVRLKGVLEGGDGKKGEVENGEKGTDNEEGEGMSKEDQEEEISHLDFLIEYIDAEFFETTKDIENLLPQGLITYDLLWTIFKPHTTIFAHGHHDRQRCFRLSSGSYVATSEAHFALHADYVDYNGTHFGHARTSIPIRPFEGTASITSLAAFPLSYHVRKEDVRTRLVERGRRFEVLVGAHYMQYQGIALGEKLQCGRAQYSIRGRVMCDKTTYNRINPDREISLTPFPGQSVDIGSDSDTVSCQDATILAKLSDDDCLLTTFLISGFALTEKKWVDFYIDSLSPIVWNTHAFDQLVLPASQKTLIRALVESHVRDSDGFDDIIRGKGKGFISILHGPPGVGKTLTAESVAEHTRRPLYSVSSGELGIDPSELEGNLSRILDVASQWKAVLLLDEADVFLETRSLHDLTRNSLVSIFLRLLEYYQGILFLTSNRVTTFDEAFQSRIHVALKYNKLDKAAREKVWRNFMDFSQLENGENLLEMVASRELNGRQIKNCVRTARSLAESEGKKVGLEHLMVVLDIQQRFEDDFGGLTKSGAAVNGTTVVNGDK